jgi:hypothetical protein
MDRDLGAGKSNGPGVREPGHIAAPTGLWLPGHQPPPVVAYQPGDLLHVGDEIDGDEAPQIAGKTLRITCEVKPKSKNAVIVAQGGKNIGYSLYLTDGIPTFGVREGGKLFTIAALAAPKKAYTLEAQLQADGKMMLAINGKSAALGKAPGLFSRQPSEGMDVGFDDGAPVAKYKGNVKDPFQGKLSKLKIVAEDVAPPP